MLLKHDKKKLCMNYEAKMEIWNGWKHDLQPPTFDVIRNKERKRIIA